MKKEMKMMPNGNYESAVLPIQHQCVSGSWKCTHYSWKSMLILEIEEGDPYEDGYSNEIGVSFCPFCGYKYDQSC